VIVDASPARLDRLLKVGIPFVRVRYRFEQKSGPPIIDLAETAISARVTKIE
jgi:hypothetical protein